MPDSLSLTKRQHKIFWQTSALGMLRSILAYLGIAVVVTVLMVVSVPSVRDQVYVLHQAILVALVPDGMEVDPAQVVDPVSVIPQASPVDLGELPARRLGRVQPPAEVQKPVARTDPMGLLGNIRVDRLQSAMEDFALTRAQLDALENYIARKYRVGRDVIHSLMETVLVVSKDLDVHPLLTLAVMSVESRFNPYAESGAGAQGLMQVMSRVHKDKFEKLGQTQDAAFHPQHNIRVGVQILSDCIKRRGSVANGLKCYVGATGPNDGGYGSRVLSEQRRMALAAKVALPR